MPVLVLIIGLVVILAASKGVAEPGPRTGGPGGLAGSGGGPGPEGISPETAITWEVVSMKVDPDAHPLSPHSHTLRQQVGGDGVWRLGDMEAGVQLPMFNKAANGGYEDSIYKSHYHYIMLTGPQLETLRTQGIVETVSTYGFNIETPKPPVEYYHSHRVRLRATP